MATIKEINHDSSTTIGDHYGSVTDPDGAVTVTTGAALRSSTNGIDADFDAGTNIPNLVETFTFSVNEFRWRVVIQLDNLVSAGAATPVDFFLEDSSGGDEFKIVVTSVAGSLYTADASYNRDVGGITALGGASIPSTGEVCMEIRAIRETGASAADGEVEFFINGVSIAAVTNAENFTQFAQIAQTRIRFGSNDADLSGTLFYDEWILDDDNTAALGCLVFTGYDLIVSAGGLAKHSIGVPADGAFLFLGLENNATNNQVVLRVVRPTSTTPTTIVAYDPGAGSAANIEPTGDNDIMIFNGNFGTDRGVIKHAIAAITNTNISPASVGAKVIAPVLIDPSDITHLIGVNVDDQDAIESEDTGASWATLNATLGQTVVAMAIIWLGQYFPAGAFFGGNDGADENLEYTPNEFSALREDTSAALKAVGAITAIDVTLT